MSMNLTFQHKRTKEYIDVLPQLSTHHSEKIMKIYGDRKKVNELGRLLKEIYKWDYFDVTETLSIFKQCLNNPNYKLRIR
jgi:hypothetical protein